MEPGGIMGLLSLRRSIVDRTSVEARASVAPPRPGKSLHRFANPGRFLRLSGRVLPWLTVAALAVLAVGLPWALMFSPPDWQQGETVRLLYIHVPMAWLAMGGYVGLAIG